MKITIEPTDKIVEVHPPGQGTVNARVWEGTTEKGVKCSLLIVRVAADEKEDLSEFEKDLQEKKRPTVPETQAFPPRLVL